MADFLVTNLNNSGTGSLREAIAVANATVGVTDTITFDPSLANQIITLTSGELLITDDLTIDGDLDNDGDADITIFRSPTAGAFRIFNIDDGDFTPDLTVTLDGLNIVGGLTTADDEDGGGIRSLENLEVKKAPSAATLPLETGAKAAAFIALMAT
jgi:hypothetical protein